MSPAAAQTKARATKTKAVIPRLAWNQVRPAPIVLVSGAESFLADRAITALRDFLRTEDPALEVTDLAADSYEQGALFAAASPSLFNEPRLVRIANAEKCGDAFMQDMITYLDEPAPDTYVVVRHGGGVRGKKLLDQIRAAEGDAVEIVCDPLKRDSDKMNFAAGEFSAAGRSVSSGAIRALVSAFSDDLAQLGAACAQLIVDIPGNIDEATVDRYCGGRVTTSGFAVADAAIAGRYSDALVALRHALASGADPVPIVAAFAMKIRTMAKVYGSRGSSAKIASELGLAPWQVEKAVRDVRGWSESGLARCVMAVADADAGVKGASRDPVYTVERLVTVVSSRGTAP